MKIDNRKLDMMLAKRCINMRGLQTAVSTNTITRIRKGNEILPATLGRIARELNCDPAELIAEEEEP